MTLSKILILACSSIVIINASVLGTLFGTGFFDEHDDSAEEPAVETAELPPLDPFVFKSGYVRSIGDAIGICENRLHDSVSQQKSWSVDSIESRYNTNDEYYSVFMEYETVAKLDQPSSAFEVTCEVDAKSHAITNWKALPK